MVADDVSSLRRGMRDLVALTALPAIWAGRQPRDVAEGLADVLITILRLDLVYICFKEPPEGVPVEIVRAGQELITGEQAAEIGKNFAPWLKANPPGSLVSLPELLHDDTLQ